MNRMTTCCSTGGQGGETSCPPSLPRPGVAAVEEGGREGRGGQKEGPKWRMRRAMRRRKRVINLEAWVKQVAEA